MFAERYQRDALLDLLLVKGHPIMGLEIRHQLIAGSKGTGEGDDDAGRRPDDGVVVSQHCRYLLYRLVMGWGHKIK